MIPRIKSGVGCPIRRSRDHRSLASPPGFSQRATSFIASQCQGIHQMPFSALDPRRNLGSAVPYRRVQGQNPVARTSGRQAPAKGGGPQTPTASHEDTSRTGWRQAQGLRPSAVRLGHIATLSSPFNQHPPPRVAPKRVSRWSSPSVAPPPLAAARRQVSPVVEVNGIEPMTSCLQSRRSPN